MATTTQYTGVLTQVDEAGNKYELYPDVKTDSTLSTSGKAADAKAVGNKTTKIDNSIKTYDDMMANTVEGHLADSLAIKAGFNAVNDSLGGYSFFNNPTVIALVSDGSLYTDDNGYYILANSDTGSTLLADSETYTTATAEGDFVKVIGADSVRPFNSSGYYETIEHFHNLEGNWVSSAQNAIYSTSLDLTSHINGRTVKNIYVDLSKSYAILCSTTNGNPGKNVSISVAYNNETNVISATWSTVSSYRGAGYYIVIRIEYY